MGRLTQINSFLNAEKMPSSTEIKHRYTSLDINDDLKKFRRKFRANLKKQGLVSRCILTGKEVKIRSAT